MTSTDMKFWIKRLSIEEFFKKFKLETHMTQAVIQEYKDNNLIEFIKWLYF